jgi:hypothetical protein
LKQTDGWADVMCQASSAGNHHSVIHPSTHPTTYAERWDFIRRENECKRSLSKGTQNLIISVVPAPESRSSGKPPPHTPLPQGLLGIVCWAYRRIGE